MKTHHGFHLEKWFLDFVTDEGEAMIFYVATLKWRNVQVPYTSWASFTPVTKTKLRTRFHQISIPERKDRFIVWSDPHFGVTGEWEAMADPLEARLFESEDGWLDWNCIQPASKVLLKIGGKSFEGDGYVEYLNLTANAWDIPMHELRWGRFGSQGNNLVWIEIGKNERKQWLWLNGEKMGAASIENDQISIPEKNIFLDLDQRKTLDSDKTILHVVRELEVFLPGFKNSMPLHFLMADQHRWLSRGVLRKNGKQVSEGWAIHELVDFGEK